MTCDISYFHISSWSIPILILVVYILIGPFNTLKAITFKSVCHTSDIEFHCFQVLFINVHLTSSARPSGDIRRVRLRLRISTKNTCQTIWKLFWSDWSWLRCSRHSYVVILVLIAGRLRLRHKVSHERITWLAFWNGRASQVEGSHHLLLLLSFHILLSFTEHSRAARLTRHIACSLMRQPRAIHEIILILCGIGPLFSSLHRCLHVQLSSTSVKH